MRRRWLFFQIVFMLCLAFSYNLWLDTYLHGPRLGETVWLGMGLLFAVLAGVSHGGYWFALGDDDIPLSGFLLMLISAGIVVAVIRLFQLEDGSGVGGFNSNFALLAIMLAACPFVAWYIRWTYTVEE